MLNWLKRLFSKLFKRKAKKVELQKEAVSPFCTTKYSVPRKMNHPRVNWTISEEEELAMVQMQVEDDMIRAEIAEEIVEDTVEDIIMDTITQEEIMGEAAEIAYERDDDDRRRDWDSSPSYDYTPSYDNTPSYEPSPHHDSGSSYDSGSSWGSDSGSSYDSGSSWGSDSGSSYDSGSNDNNNWDW